MSQNKSAQKPESSIEVLKIGTRVKLAEDVIATITSISISGNDHVTYQCGWWNGRSYDSKWFHSSEFEMTNEERLKIGFA